MIGKQSYPEIFKLVDGEGDRMISPPGLTGQLPHIPPRQGSLRRIKGTSKNWPEMKNGDSDEEKSGFASVWIQSDSDASKA